MIRKSLEQKIIENFLTGRIHNRSHALVTLRIFLGLKATGGRIQVARGNDLQPNREIDIPKLRQLAVDSSSGGSLEVMLIDCCMIKFASSVTYRTILDYCILSKASHSKSTCKK